MSKDFLNSLLDSFFPISCFFCHYPKNRRHNPNGVLCLDCQRKINLNTWLFCPICNKKIPSGRQIKNNCQKHQKTFQYLGAATDYNDPHLKPLILEYKYAFNEKLGEIFSELLFAYFAKIKDLIQPPIDKSWIVTNIPLSPKKERWRGFNQSKILAENFAQKTGLGFITTLKRKKSQTPQAKLESKRERLENIKGAFEIGKNIILNDQNIILIDDVYATGATILEAGKILKKNKVKNIFGLVLARKN